MTAVIVSAVACDATAAPRDPGLKLERAFKRVTFDQPVYMLQAPGDPSHWYLVEKDGVIYRFGAGGNGSDRTVALDIRRQVESGPNEAGLLSFAFHPKFKDNGRVFLSYNYGSRRRLRSRISEVRSTDGGKTFDPRGERTLIDLAQPYGNHNGGQILFGPDGFLYIAFGDGGAADDPEDSGQDTNTLLGAMLRIDVDRRDRGAYGIPRDNPFAAKPGAPEIFAWGLRNVWRFSFDRQTGALWAGDVGQYHWEEIDRVDLGKNYGWRLREGKRCYIPKRCDPAGLVDPVVEYNHHPGDKSVTGGYVYRGEKIPALFGHYIYGDFASGRIWGFDVASPAPKPKLLIDTDTNIASFAEGVDGEQYLLDYYTGEILRLLPPAAS